MLDHAADKWKSDLSTVSVSGQQQRHGLWKSWKDVRVVRQRDYWLALRNLLDCLVDSLRALHRSAKPTSQNDLFRAFICAVSFSKTLMPFCSNS